ncbi:MAG: hypothetical protein WDM81_09245 [Rhizomicrobium sp.]
MHRAHRAAMQKLAVDTLGEAALLEDDPRRRPLWVGKRRDVDIGNALAVARRGQVTLRSLTEAPRSRAWATSWSKGFRKGPDL